MAITSSLYSSISGLNVMGEAMSVIGDNVANVNTVAFKSSRSTFQDVLAQTVATASGASQVGRGVTLSTIDGLFSQGSFETSSQPTDMGIGGQGFFILREPGSADNLVFSRAGEFRFDAEGNLINSSGYFIQGWAIDSTTEQRSGTRDDITIGKSTQPVATDAVEVIVNLDARLNNEDNEIRLFDAWDGRRAAAASPTPPIDPTNYEYTSAIKVYDEQGDSHDLTIYFDRTTEDNQWEFLVTCEPSEDHRQLTAEESVIFDGATELDYVLHKGAGALLYGVIDFTTSGDIDTIAAYNVPADAVVDPALNDNRVALAASDSYFQFPANFTGADDNLSVELSFGATFSGSATAQAQILVSDGGGFADSNGTTYLTEETLWGSVYDRNGNRMRQGDTFILEGYDRDGLQVTPLVYVVDASTKVSDFLTQIDNTFGCISSIDTQGRLRIADATGGDSGMYVTSFATITANDATPFGSRRTVTGNWSISDSGATLNGTTPITTATTLLTDMRDSTNSPVEANDTFAFTGTAIDGNPVTDTFTVGLDNDADGTNDTTIQDLLDWLADLYADGAVDGSAAGVTTVLDSNGQIRIIDETNSGNLAVSLVFTDISGGGTSSPFGDFSLQNSVDTDINITTSKQKIFSRGQAFSTNSGAPPVITPITQLSEVYDVNSLSLRDGDQIIFTGTMGDGTPVNAESFIVVNASTQTVQDLLDRVEEIFNCNAEIDQAGRLVLTDRVADTATRSSQLAIGSITYQNASGLGPGAAPGGDPALSQIFGADGLDFATILADIGYEDGSRQGDVVYTSFESAALTTTQFANSSTTIFQDQDGFAAGFLQSVSVDTKGVITGHYSNGQVLKKAQVTLASFNNIAGLFKQGGNTFIETTESGPPTEGPPGENGLGSISPNSLEQSNVDLGAEFVRMITVQRGFQANARVITTTDEMITELIQLKR
ncbi:MAG: flagellar hook-basal body complex protein [Thermodesulfobacteriota bacterium]